MRGLPRRTAAARGAAAEPEPEAPPANEEDGVEHLLQHLKTSATGTTTMRCEGWRGAAGGPLHGSLADADDFFLFTNLLIIDLADNMLAGPLPLAQIGSTMPDLKILNLSRNKFTGPLENSSLPSLRGLLELVRSFFPKSGGVAGVVGCG